MNREKLAMGVMSNQSQDIVNCPPRKSITITDMNICNTSEQPTKVTIGISAGGNIIYIYKQHLLAKNKTIIRKGLVLPEGSKLIAFADNENVINYSIDGTIN